MQRHGVPSLLAGIKDAVNALLEKSQVEMPMLHITTVRAVDTMLDCGKSTNTITGLHAIMVTLRVIWMKI
jgi:hypothetical protein